MFGTNNHNKKCNGTIIENYTKCEGSLNQHIKCFLNIKKIKEQHNKYLHAPNPHFYKLNNMDLSVGINFKNLDKVNTHFFINTLDFNSIDAYIAHYVYQSYEDYIKRKIQLPRDDNNLFRSKDTEEFIHAHYNNIINTKVKDKYNEINKKNIQKYL